MSTSPEVDAWFAGSEHPKKDLMQVIRQKILDADARVTETVKWKTPTFMFNGNIASFNPQAKAFVSLMFHRGADIPGDFPSLQGGGDTTRYMRFDDAADIERQSAELQAIIRAWCTLRQK